LASTKSGIQKSREAVTDDLEKWRELQSIQMNAVSDQVLSQPPCPVEEEDLFLPSSFSEKDRTFLGKLSKLAVDEALLRLKTAES
jgi:hypothetical protein